jgi:hypothetical protein
MAGPRAAKLASVEKKQVTTAGTRNARLQVMQMFICCLDVDIQRDVWYGEGGNDTRGSVNADAGNKHGGDMCMVYVVWCMVYGERERLCAL